MTTAVAGPAPRATDEPAAPDRRNVMTIFIGLSLGMLLAAVAQTIVAPALPRIVAELGGIEHYSWIAVSTLLASTVVVPIVGKLSDLFGRKAFYVGGVVTFMTASVIAGLAQSFETFMIARVIEGFGMGTMMPLSQAIIGDIIAPRDRGKYQGAMGAVFGLASIVGPFAGGYITDNLSWHWLFFINIPVGIIALGFIVPFMRLPHVRRAHTIDYAGIITLTIALTATLLATVWGGVQFPWGSPQIIGAYVIGAIALALFVAVERRAVDPVLPLQLWRSRIFATANIATMTLAMGMFGAIYFIPIFVQGVIGTSVTRSGAILTPMMLGLVTTSALNGQLISKTGRYKASIVAGVLLVGIGFILLSRMDRGTSLTTVTINMLFVGVGLGAAMQTFTLVVQNAVRRQDMGTATAATQLFRSIGSTIGIAILGTLMTNGMAREIPRRVPASAVAAMPKTTTSAAGHGELGAGAVLDPVTLAQLPPDVREGIRDGLAAALHPVFLAGIPFLAIALLASILIPEVPLRRASGADAGDAGREVLAELAHSGPEDSVPVLGKDNPLYSERTRLLGAVFGLVATQADPHPNGELTRVLERLGDGDAARGRHHLAVLAAALSREGGDADSAAARAAGPGPERVLASSAPAEILERFLDARPVELRDHLRAIVRREESDGAQGLTPADLETLERVAVAAAAAALLDRS